MNYIQALPSTTDDSLLDNLSPADFLLYGRTCRTAYHTVKSYIQRRFQVHRLLAPYFTESEITHFRALQYSTGMFISGSTALQFFTRTHYPESDLDLYLEHRYRKEVALWLTEIGYNYRPKGNIKSLEDALALDETDDMEGFAPQQTRAYLGAKMVLDFEKQEPYRKIQLITTHRSAFERLLNFHSTCVMNLITYDRAYCLYPLATLEERNSLTFLRDSRPSERRIRDKYVSRGFELLHYITRSEFDDPRAAFARGERHVGDDRCWTVPILPRFDYSNIIELDVLDLKLRRPIEVNSWELLYDTDLYPKVSYNLFVARKLRFHYTLVVDDRSVLKLDSLIFELLPKICDIDGDDTNFDLKLEYLLEVCREYQKNPLYLEEDHVSVEQQRQSL